jgi:hypothetical protein
MNYTCSVADFSYDEATRCQRTLTSYPSRWVVDCVGDCFVSPAGVEPATIRLRGGCSIQLSYGDFVGHRELTLPVADVFSKRSIPDNRGFSFAGCRAPKSSCARGRRYWRAASAAEGRKIFPYIKSSLRSAQRRANAVTFQAKRKPARLELSDPYGLYRMAA